MNKRKEVFISHLSSYKGADLWRVYLTAYTTLLVSPACEGGATHKRVYLTIYMILIHLYKKKVVRSARYSTDKNQGRKTCHNPIEKFTDLIHEKKRMPINLRLQVYPLKQLPAQKGLPLQPWAALPKEVFEPPNKEFSKKLGSHQTAIPQQQTSAALGLKWSHRSHTLSLWFWEGIHNSLGQPGPGTFQSQ